MAKDRLDLENIVLIGRTFREYEGMFRLKDLDPKQDRILDVASGVSSFCAEATKLGWDVLAIDPIYGLEPEEIENKCARNLAILMNELKGAEHLYVWDVFRDPNGLKLNRERAYKTFIEHYRKDRTRYVAEKMPETRLDSGRFTVALISHLLFVYDAMLDYRFHKETIRKTLRLVSKEVRIFPLVNLTGGESPFLREVLNDEDFRGCKLLVEKVDYEFMRGGNKMLRIVKC